MRTLIVLLLMWAGITITPDHPLPGHKITATVDADIPPGAEFHGGWEIDAETAELAEENTIGIWVPQSGAKKLTYKGYYVLLGEPIKVKDVDGNVHELTPYLGSGLVNEEAEVVVGELPSPDPPNPTPALIDRPGLSVLIVHESSQPLPRAQQAILTGTAWQAIVGSGNWQVLDKDTKFNQPSPWQDALNATKDKGIPRLIISKQGKGGWVGPLPADNAAMIDLVQDWERR